MLESDRGLVLRTYKLRETSKITSILGFAHGRVRLVAHGGRAGGHRFGASLEVGNEVEFVYSLPPERELGTLREATLRRAHLAGVARLEVLGAGLAVIELLDRLVPEGAGEPGLGEEAAVALRAMAGAADRAGVLLLFYGFECRLLARLGLEPQVGACERCGRAAGERPGRLDVRAGAFHCRSCASGEGGVSLPPEAARLLAVLASGSASEIAGEQSSPRNRRLVGLCLHRLMATHLERYRYPRALELLKKVDRARGDAGETDPSSGFPTIA